MNYVFAPAMKRQHTVFALTRFRASIAAAVLFGCGCFGSLRFGIYSIIPNSNKGGNTMHQHTEPCGCGAGHQGCNHTEHHHHDEHCGCGHTHAPVSTPEGLTNIQVDFLLALRERRFLPVACFSVAKAGDDTRHAVALDPVYLGSADDTMEQVKQIGKELSLLEDMDLLTLDYDIPLKNYPYEEYKASELYAYFAETVREAAQKPGATFDTPILELGSMMLTEAGEAMVDTLIQ